MAPDMVEVGFVKTIEDNWGIYLGPWRLSLIDPAWDSAKVALHNGVVSAK